LLQIQNKIEGIGEKQIESIIKNNLLEVLNKKNQCLGLRLMSNPTLTSNVIETF
jgi:uncharacterized protein YejL (UPF0352 family)